MEVPELRVQKKVKSMQAGTSLPHDQLGTHRTIPLCAFLICMAFSAADTP